jgi:hypothetical protein
VPPRVTVAAHTGVGITVEKDGVGVDGTDDDHPVALASYSSRPSALKFRVKSWTIHPGYDRTLAE